VIINLRAKNWPAIIDEVVQGYQASLPVVGDEDLIVGSVWLAERGRPLVVLDVIQPGALAHWDGLGKDVLYVNDTPDDTPADLDILCVTDTPDQELAHSALISADDDQLVAYIEEALCNSN